MKILNQRPPAWIYDACIKQFDPPKGTVFSVADVIYNPDGIDIPDHLIIHENVHGSQQQYDEEVATAWKWKHTTSNTNTSVQKSKTKMLDSEICTCSPNLCVRLCTDSVSHTQTLFAGSEDSYAQLKTEKYDTIKKEYFVYV